MNKAVHFVPDGTNFIVPPTEPRRNIAVRQSVAMGILLAQDLNLILLKRRT